jgi:hypothetical protein
MASNMEITRLMFEKAGKMFKKKKYGKVMNCVEKSWSILDCPQETVMFCW